MKHLCAHILISAICLISFSCINATQEIKVKLVIDGSKCFRRNVVPSEQLDKWGRFYGQQAPPFEYYFSVVSAKYEDCLNEGIILHKNLMNKLPAIIRNDQNLDKEERKEYFFPKYISQSFIEQLQNSQADGKKIKRKFYVHRDLKKSLLISYTFEYQEQNNQTGAEDAVAPCIPVLSQLYQDYASDCMVDLVALLSLFIG